MPMAHQGKWKRMRVRKQQWLSNIRCPQRLSSKIPQVIRDQRRQTVVAKVQGKRPCRKPQKHFENIQNQRLLNKTSCTGYSYRRGNLALQANSIGGGGVGVQGLRTVEALPPPVGASPVSSTGAHHTHSRAKQKDVLIAWNRAEEAEQDPWFLFSRPPFGSDTKTLFHDPDVRTPQELEEVS